MRNRHFFAKFIILLIIAGIFFFAGYLQFRVKSGNCGVLVSRTGGIYQKPIVQGNFDWRWEPLIPTNADIRVFPLSAYSSRQLVSGILPSSDIYKKMLDTECDFSYSATLKIQLRMTPQGLVEEVKRTDIKSLQELNAVLETKAAVAAKLVMEYFLREKQNNLSFSSTAVTADEIKNIIAMNSVEFENIEITDIIIIDSHTPDFALYNKAREAYGEYEKVFAKALEKEAQSNAKAVFEQNAAMERLEKLGKLLEKYPQLQELIKGGDINSLMNAIKIVR